MFKRKKAKTNTKDPEFLRSVCLNSKSIDEYFWNSSQLGNDNKKFSTNELLPVISLITKDYDIQVAAEYGTAQCRVSSALIMGGVETLYSVDIEKDQVVDHFYELTKDTRCNFIFENIDSAKYNLPKVDLLFIDSLHNREHLAKELKLHTRVKKLILLHDTETFKDVGDEGGNLEIEINSFLKQNSEWKILYKFVHNNGLTVLEKIE